jgi:hypothetical protein
VTRTARLVSHKVVPLLPKQLEREVESILKQAKIYNIEHIGWLNQNDPDPNQIGHAMWQLDQPRIDERALIGESPVRTRPSDLEKEILTAGEDFYGLMQASRLSIGLFLLWMNHSGNNLFDQSPFSQLHYIDAFIKLAIASDRLRDLLIIACTGASKKIYEAQDRKKGRFTTPFMDANALLNSRGLSDPRLAEPVMALPEIAKKLWSYRERRNKIVHEVATSVGALMRDSVTELQERYDQEQEKGFSPRSVDFEQWSAASEASVRQDRERTNLMIYDLRNWYELLINASNLVFQVEHWSRKLHRK